MIMRDSNQSLMASAAVIQSYRIALGRSPEPAAIDYWIEFLNDGHTLKDLVAQITASAEFEALNGPATASNFNAIRSLYRRCAGGRLSRRQKVAVVSSWLLRRSARRVTFGLCRSRLSHSSGFQFPLLYPSGANPLDEVAYRYWVADYEKWLRTKPSLQSDFKMKFSFILETSGGSELLAQESIQSVVAQTYPNWELLVIGDSQPGTADSLLQSFKDHENVRWIDRSSVGNPLSAATGDFVGWLNPGDRLNSLALSETARVIRQHPNAALLYTDEDLIDDQGRRSSPVFKSSWSPDLLLAGDALGSLVLLRRDRLTRLGRDGEVYSRFDLLLRFMGAAEPESILHVPGPLYHRRCSGGKVPFRFPEKLANLGTPCWKSSVEQYLAETDSGIELHSAFLGGRIWPRPVFPLPDPAPSVSVIIPTRDMPELLGPCVNGILFHTDYSNLEVLIIDNDSSGIGTRLLFSQFSADPRVRIIPFPGEFNWSGANNLGAEKAWGDVLLFLNNDIEITNPDWLRELVSHVVRPSVGVVGAKLYYKDGRVQHAGMVFDGHDNCVHVHRFADPEDPGFQGQMALVRDVSAVTGACMAMRKEVFVALGGFEQHHLKVTWSDVDLCLRARAQKLRVIYTPFANLNHLECATRGKDIDPIRLARFLEERKYMQRTWGESLRDDRFVNPHLDASESGFSLSTSIAARGIS